MDEADLIARARRGDETAWLALVEAHQAALFRLAYLLLGDADDAADVAQDAFIRAGRALDRFDPARGTLRPWLLRIAANLAHNRRRSLRRYLAALRRSALAAPEPVTTLGERTTHQEEAHTLWQAVRR